MVEQTESIELRVREAHDSGDYTPLIETIPYARMIGMRMQRLGEELVFQLPIKPDNIGNPMLPAIHGGVIAGFMEQAAMLHLMIKMHSPAFPRIIDLSIDYL